MKIARLDRRLSYRGFAFSAASMLVVTGAAALPMPLFATYQKTMGMTNSDISAAMFLYLGAITLTLLFGGRLTDALGRKTGLLLGLALALGSCLVFAFASTAVAVFAARLLQGFAVGVAMSAISAYGIDCIRDVRLSWGSAMASCGVLVGLMAGSLAMGALADGTDSARTVYLATAVIALLCGIAVLRAPETVEERERLSVVLRPRIMVPERGARRAFVGTLLAYTAVWGIAAYFQTFASSYCSSYFAQDDPMASALLLALVMAPSAAGSVIVSKIGMRSSMRLGIVAAVLSGAALLFSSLNGIFVLFLGACGAFGVSMGACLTGALQSVLSGCEPEDNSTIISTVNLIAYASISVLSVGSSVLATAQPLFAILALHVALAALFTPAILASSRA